MPIALQLTFKLRVKVMVMVVVFGISQNTFADIFLLHSASLSAQLNKFRHKQIIRVT